MCFVISNMRVPKSKCSIVLLLRTASLSRVVSCSLMFVIESIRHTKFHKTKEESHELGASKNNLCDSLKLVRGLRIRSCQS